MKTLHSQHTPEYGFARLEAPRAKCGLVPLELGTLGPGCQSRRWWSPASAMGYEAAMDWSVTSEPELWLQPWNQL
jgi:hypothetical protein